MGQRSAKSKEKGTEQEKHGGLSDHDVGRTPGRGSGVGRRVRERESLMTQF